MTGQEQISGLLKIHGARNFLVSSPIKSKKSDGKKKKSVKKRSVKKTEKKDGSLMVDTPIRPWNTCKVFKSL
jgi:hypothetical protein